MRFNASTATWVGMLVLSASVAFGGCGSSDEKHKVRDTSAGGQAGDGGNGAAAGSAGAPDGAGAGPVLGSAGEGGAVASGGATNPAGAGQGGAEAGQPGTGTDAGAGGGADGPRIFSTITALYDAIDAAELAEGDAWRVEWATDGRVAAGSITGVLEQGVPRPPVLDQGVLPLKLFTATDWLAGGLAGSLSFDADGYPTLALGTNAVAGVAASARLSFVRYKFRRFTSARMRIAQNMSTVATASGVQFELWDGGGQNRLSANHFYSGGVGQGVALDYYHGGIQVLTGGVVTTTHPRIFDGFWNLVPASPTSVTLNVTMRLDDLQSAALGSDSSAIVGHGDWSQDLGFDYAPYIGMYRTAGGSGTATATGVSVEITRYVP